MPSQLFVVSFLYYYPRTHYDYDDGYKTCLLWHFSVSQLYWGWEKKLFFSFISSTISIIFMCWFLLILLLMLLLSHTTFSQSLWMVEWLFSSSSIKRNVENGARNEGSKKVIIKDKIFNVKINNLMNCMNYIHFGSLWLVAAIHFFFVCEEK